MSAAASDLPRSTSQATSAPRSTERQAVASTPSCYSAACTKPSTTARRTGAAHQWERRGAHHRSTGRQSLEEELQSAAFDGTARYVWRFGGNYVEAVWAVTSAAGCARHAVIPSARADEHKQISLRRKPRAHVARDRHDRGLDGNTAEGRRGWLGPPPCGQELPARTGRRGTNLYRRA